MLIKIRTGVFETNSSSSHSLSIGKKDTVVANKNPGVWEVLFGEYGWGYERLTEPVEKLSYVLTSIQYYDPNIDYSNVSAQKIMDSVYFEWIAQAFHEIGILVIPKESEDFYPCGYVDHESTDLLADVFHSSQEEFQKKIIDLVFNEKYVIIIDNDNH